MQVTDLLTRAGSTPLGGTKPQSRIEALLPTSGISIGPPVAEDRVEISPLAHAMLRMNLELELAEGERVNELRLRYLRGADDPDPDQLARRILASLPAQPATRSGIPIPKPKENDLMASALGRELFGTSRERAVHNSRPTADEWEQVYANE